MTARDRGLKQEECPAVSESSPRDNQPPISAEPDKATLYQPRDTLRGPATAHTIKCSHRRTLRRCRSQARARLSADAE